MPSVHAIKSCGVAALLTALSGTALAAQLPNRVAAGDTTQTSTVLWGRAAVPGNFTFELSTDQNFSSTLLTHNDPVVDPTLPLKLPVTGLNPGTQYYYRATDAAGNTSTGRFKTNRAAGFNGARFGVSGDWRGELAPYPGIRNAPGRDLDAFIALGDTVYADVSSPAVPAPQATTLAEFRAKHNEVYSERFGLNTLGDLRSSTSVISIIDDHEVTNDFSGGAHPASDPRFSGQPGNFINETPLFNTGIQAFEEYNPLNPERYANTGVDPRMDGKVKLGRTRTYGKDAMIATLDTRTFRDQGLPAANPLDPASVTNYLVQSFNPTRTLLGGRQLADVKSDLLNAQASGTTWKFVMVPEPIQNLGVLNASDRFEGYAAERADLLRFIDQNDIQNVVFVAADIHGTLVNNLTYQNGPGQSQISSGAWEITTGSLAYDAPFGPTVAGIAANLGVPGAIPLGVYNSLPVAQREAYIQGLINAQITPLGYDPLGLQGSGIPATLLQGGYTATNTYGWTEFDIDPLTQALTVTTYGIPYYTEADLLANPSLIAGLQPQIVSQFVVQAVPAPGAAGLLALAGFVAARRRRN
ncbi:MAG: alkaline phosphatase D family protein [Planctomycetota bacterium]|nr:alkaline phosphatase D family protein [Planctomycetota bacterium]